MTSMIVPAHAVASTPVELQCNVDMQGEALYAVKWYKDGHEFYCFSPSDSPQAISFKVHGIHVRVSTHSASVISNSQREHKNKERINTFFKWTRDLKQIDH